MESTTSQLKFDHLTPFWNMSEVLTEGAEILAPGFITKTYSVVVKTKIDIFLIFAQNIDCGYTLEPPHPGGSYEYPQSIFWSKYKKKIGIPPHIPVLLYKSGV